MNTIQSQENMMHTLVLLIGSNPLPNAMAAAYLLKDHRQDAGEMPKPDKILLVYSTETQKYADSLQAVIKELYADLPDDSFALLDLGTEERNHDAIKTRIVKKITELQPCSVHLNYTGGTKVMSCAAAAAIPNGIHSYIDPGEHKFVLNNGNSYPTNTDLRSKISLSIPQLYQLHALEHNRLRLQNATPCHFEQVAPSKMLEKRMDKTHRPLFENWFTVPRKKRHQDFNTALEGLNFILATLKQQTSAVLESDFGLPDAVSNKNDASAWKEAAKYINGEWLEQYVFKTLQEIKDSHEPCGITYIAWDLEYKNQNGEGVRQFQIDVACMRGTEFFLFTCTTSDETGTIKGKAFEALYRANLIAGSQAKVVSVSIADQETVKLLEKDLLQFDAEKRTAILGQEHIKPENISENLKRVIKGEWENV